MVKLNHAQIITITSANYKHNLSAAMFIRLCSVCLVGSVFSVLHLPEAYDRDQLPSKPTDVSVKVWIGSIEYWDNKLEVVFSLIQKWKDWRFLNMSSDAQAANGDEYKKLWFPNLRFWGPSEVTEIQPDASPSIFINPDGHITLLRSFNIKLPHGRDISEFFDLPNTLSYGMNIVSLVHGHKEMKLKWDKYDAVSSLNNYQTIRLMNITTKSTSVEQSFQQGVATHLTLTFTVKLK